MHIFGQAKCWFRIFGSGSMLVRILMPVVIVPAWACLVEVYGYLGSWYMARTT